MKDNERLNLSLNETQAKVLINALDLYSRVYMGQLGDIRRMVVMENKRFRDSPSDNVMVDGVELGKLLDMCESRITNLASGGYFSISSPEISDVARVAYDIQQVVRHSIAWHDNPKDGGHGVWAQKPMKYSQHELPKAKIVALA